MPQISQYTQNENWNGDNQRNFLDKLSMMNPSLSINQEEGFGLGIKQQEPMMSAEELRNTNCQKILQQTQKDLRTLLYRASKLVTCENQHGLLEKSEKYDIVEGTNDFVKVPIKYKKPPVVLSFDYGNEMSKKNDLLVCISRKHKQPTH